MIKKCPKSDSGKHNWVVRGTPAVLAMTSGNELDPPLWHWCNFCGAVNREVTLCESQVRNPGRWPSWSTCGKKASVTADGKNYCRRHDPAAVAERREQEMKTAERSFQAALYANRWGWNASKTVPVLQQLKEWAGQNSDLIDADEWLGQIVRDLREIDLP